MDHYKIFLMNSFLQLSLTSFLFNQCLILSFTLNTKCVFNLLPLDRNWSNDAQLS